ncbi:MAG: ECF-type sigma factor [Gemmataceae bacterium]
MSTEVSGHTLNPTALVHETYLRLIGPADDCRWDGHGHFFAAAAEAMRHILVESARRRRGSVHGGRRGRVDIDRAEVVTGQPPNLYLALDEAPNQLGPHDPVVGRLDGLAYLAGQSVEPAADALGLSLAIAFRYSAFIRAGLVCRARRGQPGPDQAGGCLASDSKPRVGEHKEKRLPAGRGDQRRSRHRRSFTGESMR